MWFRGRRLENCRAEDTALLLLGFLTWDTCNRTNCLMHCCGSTSSQCETILYEDKQTTSNANLNLVPVHVWELVALNGIPQASPLVRLSKRESRQLKKKRQRVAQQFKKTMFLLSLHLSNSSSDSYHGNPFRAPRVVLRSHSCAVTRQVLGPLFHFYLRLSI